MNASARINAYVRTNGQAKRLTPRQARRFVHKANHAAAPFGRKAGRDGRQ